jgi:hypothetical protein
MAFKLMYLRSLTAKAIQNIHDLNLVRRAQNDLILNRNSSGLLIDKSTSGGSSLQFKSIRGSHDDQRNRSSPNSSQNDQDDGPIQYSTSKAGNYRAADNFRLIDDDKYPPSQRHIINLSVFIFMLYFFVLREENDWDELFDKSLFDTMPQLERPILESSLINAERVGQSTKEIRTRLEELDRIELAESKVGNNE